MEEELIIIGKILKEWGVNGEVLVEPLTYDPQRFFQIKDIAIQSIGEPEWRVIKSVKKHKENLILNIEGFNNPENARRYRGALIKIRKSESPPLPKDVYYHYQIIGLMVYTFDGKYLGKIESIIETGDVDVYVIKGEDKSEEYMIPAIKDIIIDINLESNKMVIKPMEF